MEFCLPTKLQARRTNVLRSRSALDDALNAFGLFARAEQLLLLDKSIAMLMLVRWGISDIASRCARPTRTRRTFGSLQTRAASRATRSCDACSERGDSERAYSAGGSRHPPDSTGAEPARWVAQEGTHRARGEKRASPHPHGSGTQWGRAQARHRAPCSLAMIITQKQPRGDRTISRLPKLVPYMPRGKGEGGCVRSGPG